jgi:hypothetical protein
MKAPCPHCAKRRSYQANARGSGFKAYAHADRRDCSATRALRWRVDSSHVLRPVDQPTPGLRALVVHLNTSGVQGNFYPVRHAFRHSSVTAVINYKMNDCQLVGALCEH